jgi:uncharacterized protein YndB with AHSA1/START domain
VPLFLATLDHNIKSLWGPETDLFRKLDKPARKLHKMNHTAGPSAPAKVEAKDSECMDAPLVTEEIYSAAIKKVWQALTDESQMRAWYFPQLKKFSPVVGFDFEFEDDGSTYKKEWRVTQIVDGVKFSHSWKYKGYPGSSEVNFELFEEGSGTRLKLTHTGLASFPRDPHFARKRFEDGWRQLLGVNLKNHLASPHF